MDVGSSIVKIACTPDYPPFSVKKGEDLRGFHVDAAALVLEHKNIPFSISAFAWEDLGDLLKVGYGFSIFACGLTYFPEREIFGSFAGPWVTSRTILVGRKGFKTQDIESLGVNKGGYLEGVALKNFAAKKITYCTDNLKLPSLVTTGVTSHLLTDDVEFALWREAPDLEITKTLEVQKQGLFMKDRSFAIDFSKWLLEPSIQSELLKLADEYGIAKERVTLV